MFYPEKNIFGFESLGEFVRSACECPKREDTSPKWTYGNEFRTREKTVRALTDGVSGSVVRAFSELARGRFQIEMESADLQGYMRRRRRVWSDQGDPETDRVLDRRELWAGESKPGRQARVIRLGINVWMSCGNEDKDFGNLVGTACAIADTIAKLGYGIEIVGMLAGVCNNDDTGFAILFPIKRAADPLDIEAVGSIGAPGLMRDLGFSFGDKHLNGNWHGGCRVREDELKTATQVDYLVTRSWSAYSLSSTFQGVKEILDRV